MDVAVVLGTRPEIIKLAPLVLELKRRGLPHTVLFSGQHRSMAEQAFTAFGIVPDVDLALMTPDQTPNGFLSTALAAFERSLSAIGPSCVVVQGDTTTALAGALSAFHLRIPVAHVEAGLRTGDPSSPFPEEMNRLLISRLATMHFCHTEHARRNLEREGITENVSVVGNTVVDALKLVSLALDEGRLAPQEAVRTLQLAGKKLLLVTGHRRENFDQPLRNLCTALLSLVEDIPELDIVYPVHLNPKVRGTVHELLHGHSRIHLIEPVDYPSFIALMRRSDLIVSDSGGIQEEAPSLGKKVLVTRSNTERPEAADAGCSEVFPLSAPDALAQRARELLAAGAIPAEMANPYGAGDTARQIVDALERSSR